MNYYRLILATVLLGGSLVLSGCEQQSDDGPDLPPVSDVQIVGTSIDPNFRSTGLLRLGAVALSPDEEAILSGDLQTSATIQEPANLVADVSFDEIIEPSNRPLAVLLHLDQSSSMLDSDPARLRVRGAKAFADVMAGSGRAFRCAVSAFASRNGVDSFAYSDLFCGFTASLDTLRAALDLVGQETGTPTYESLLEMLPFLNQSNPATQYERVVVLLSDGQPNTTDQRDEVCHLATSLGIRIYAIGLGPASDLAGNSPAAVSEMRSIATGTGGVYAGISEADTTSATTIYQSIGTAAARGYVVYQVHFSGPAFATLTSGTAVRGQFHVASPAQGASAPLEFRVP